MAQSENFMVEKHSPSLAVLARAMPQVPTILFKSLLKLTSDIIQNNPLPPKALEKLGKGGNTEELEQIVGGLMTLLQSLQRLKSDAVKETDLRQYLANLKFSEDCINEFYQFYVENKIQLHVNRLKKCNSLYVLSFKKLEWRVDISISSNYLNKALDTIVILQILFTNGEKKTFELSLSKFNLLRLNVASMLRELQIAEKKVA